MNFKAALEQLRLLFCVKNMICALCFRIMSIVNKFLVPYEGGNYCDNIAALTSLRFFAAAYVVFFHAIELLSFDFGVFNVFLKSGVFGC